MKVVDVALLPTSMSISHTHARREASKHGVRIASMPSITEGTMSIGGLPQATYKKQGSSRNSFQIHRLG